MFIDSHCHLDNHAFDADRELVLLRAAAQNVDYLVVPAVDARSWEPVLQLATTCTAPRCAAALGLHPVSLLSTDAKTDDALLQALANVVAQARPSAIGECGLDASIDLTLASLERQEHVLRAQLALATRWHLPVILHARGSVAYRRLATLLHETGLPSAGAVIHSYGGGAHLLPELQFDTLYFGFAGPVTYPDARKTRASVCAVPRERLLAETDAPDQTPVPYRPGRSEPAYVSEIVTAMALARGESVTSMAECTGNNARRLFCLH